MAHTLTHAAVGALLGASAAVLPDAVLWTFAWRHTWLPESSAVVRAHRFIHSPSGAVAIILLAWLSHLVIDWCTPHRTAPPPTS